MRYFLAAWVGVGVPFTVALQPGGGNWPPERRRPEPTRAALESMTLDPDQDCEMRRLAYAHALSLQILFAQENLKVKLLLLLGVSYRTY